MRTIRPGTILEPVPKELILDYLRLPEELPGSYAEFFRGEEIPTMHFIHIRRIHNRNLWQYQIAYDDREAELLKYREDIFRLRWYDALRQLKKASES